MSDPANTMTLGPILSAIGPLRAPMTKNRLMAIDSTQESAPREAPKLASRAEKKAENE
jgi:hypothetical protein